LTSVLEEAVAHGVNESGNDEEELKAGVEAEVARELKVIVEEDGEGLNGLK